MGNGLLYKWEVGDLETPDTSETDTHTQDNNHGLGNMFKASAIVSLDLTGSLTDITL